MKKYRYVVVCSNGASFDLNREGSFYPHGLGATVSYDLPELLRKGWVPVRETPMGPGDTAVGYSLVVLEREAAPAPRARDRLPESPGAHHERSSPGPT